MMQQRPLVWLRPGEQFLWMLIEEGGQPRDVAEFRRVEQLSIRHQRTDVRLERAPTREPVLFCHHELRVGELRVRVRVAQFCETTLRLLAEPIDIGVIGKGQRSGRRSGRLVGHDTPSFLERAEPFQRPQSAVWARNEGSGRTVEGGLNPLRGPSAALAARDWMVPHTRRWDKRRGHECEPQAARVNVSTCRRVSHHRSKPNQPSIASLIPMHLPASD
jgi:hypothetical protein